MICEGVAFTAGLMHEVMALISRWFSMGDESPAQVDARAGMRFEVAIERMLDVGGTNIDGKSALACIYLVAGLSLLPFCPKKCQELCRLRPQISLSASLTT